MVARATVLVIPSWPVDEVGRHQVADAPPTRQARYTQAREAVVDAAFLLTIAYSLPFVIMLVGAPLALGVTLLLKLAGVR
jgi:hypothetical protein